MILPSTKSCDCVNRFLRNTYFNSRVVLKVLYILPFRDYAKFNKYLRLLNISKLFGIKFRFICLFVWNDFSFFFYSILHTHTVEEECHFDIKDILVFIIKFWNKCNISLQYLLHKIAVVLWWHCWWRRGFWLYNNRQWYYTRFWRPKKHILFYWTGGWRRLEI